MKITADVHWKTDFYAFLKKLDTRAAQKAGARGLSEHADEQRRLSIVRISASTGAPKSRIGRRMRVIRASPSPSMTATVRVNDSVILLHDYGDPVWDSSMKGAQVTGWNRRRIFEHAFVRKGYVMVRNSKDKDDLKLLSMASPANELADPFRPNARASWAFAKLDLEKRVVRHVMLGLGV